MTMKSFGRIIPLQGFMLGLAGYGPSKQDGVRDLVQGQNDDEKINAIFENRSRLVKLTGVDFGFSLKEWHDHLLSVERLKRSYTHPYGWKGVEKAILAEIANPDRERLEALAEEMEQSRKI